MVDGEEGVIKFPQTIGFATDWMGESGRSPDADTRSAVAAGVVCLSPPDPWGGGGGGGTVRYGTVQFSCTVQWKVQCKGTAENVCLGWCEWWVLTLVILGGWGCGAVAGS